MELTCCVQQYAWGKLGLESEVALLKNSSDSNLLINESAPYAELWMGTHPNGPSTLKESKINLEDWINSNPECLGEKTREKFGNKLPFLFKVLSVQKALSIQAHPNKELQQTCTEYSAGYKMELVSLTHLQSSPHFDRCVFQSDLNIFITQEHAEKLHKENPNLYKDPNHKPEIAIALTPFEALCGFRPVEEIKSFLKSIVELQNLVGQEIASQLINSEQHQTEAALKACFTELMKCPDERIAVQTNAYISRLSKMDQDLRTKNLASLFERLHSQFPGDVGCFVIYFLNYIELLPGEAVFLGPNVPHAYIFGDCIECMACSDNVVRAGLTPKFRDVETLCEMLIYSCGGSVKFTDVRQLDEHTSVFAPPIEDFAVAKIEMKKSSKYKLKPKESASICIVIQGRFIADSVVYKRGSILFLEANKSLDMEVTDEKGLLMFQAFSNA
ncbi:mannose-6-phosphate isomerase isoform X1 [Hetaerina americana]|uniref:mannose-6-phosphate isomerase isoform X1 n=1 Tax=Hetaerina americana TaxID=62018 RepID=UPI003A7F21AE